MKQIIVLSLIICICHPAYSQDCLDRIEKQAVIIDSLKKLVKTEKDKSQQLFLIYQRDTTIFLDSIKRMNSDLIKLANFKAEKANIDNLLKQKTDSIAFMNKQIFTKNQQISDEKLTCEQKSREEREKGKNEVLSSVINSYKNKRFDDLIMSSTKLSVQRDIQLVGNNSEIKPILLDLERYFNAEELLAKKIDSAQIKNAQLQLIQIKQQSVLLDKLKENIDYYEEYNDALKKTTEKLVVLDTVTDAKGDASVQKLKFNDISSELTNYIYNYYDYVYYPYLSDIVLEIIKRKQPNADADITDLLRKLQ